MRMTSRPFAVVTDDTLDTTIGASDK